MRQRRKYCRDERTFNFFVRKLIIFLFTVPFITIRADSVGRGNGTHIIGDADVDNIMNVDAKMHESGVERVVVAHIGAAKEPNNNSSSIERSEFDDRVGNRSIFGSNDGRDDEFISDENELKLSAKGPVLSRRRRYLIFPPGTSVQIGNDPLISLRHTEIIPFVCAAVSIRQRASDCRPGELLEFGHHGGDGLGAAVEAGLSR